MTTAIATPTLEDFQAQVRSVAIRVARENGWCDSGLNETLRELGLPEVKTFRISVKLPNFGTIKIEVKEAQSDAEARDMLRSDPERTMKALRRHTGYHTITEFEVMDAPPQPEAGSGVPMPGDACPEDGEWYATSIQSGGPNQCRVSDPEGSGVYCTRPVGHPADWHVAAGKNAGVLLTFQANDGDVRQDGIVPSEAFAGDAADEDDTDD